MEKNGSYQQSPFTTHPLGSFHREQIIKYPFEKDPQSPFGSQNSSDGCFKSTTTKEISPMLLKLERFHSTIEKHHAVVSHSIKFDNEKKVNILIFHSSGLTLNQSSFVDHFPDVPKPGDKVELWNSDIGWLMTKGHTQDKSRIISVTEDYIHFCLGGKRKYARRFIKRHDQRASWLNNFEGRVSPS